MSLLGRREYFLLKVSEKNIESLVDEIKSTICLPQGYDLNVNSSNYNLDVTIFGADIMKIKEIDFEVSSKILAICEKRQIDCHVMGTLEIM